MSSLSCLVFLDRYKFLATPPSRSDQFSPSTLFQPLCLCPSCSCSYHFFSLCQLTTLIIHNSLSLSLPAQDLPLSQIFPTIDSLPGLRTATPRLYDWTVSSEHLRFLFLVSSLLFFCLLPCGRLSWLLVSFWAHVNIVHRIVSYSYLHQTVISCITSIIHAARQTYHVLHSRAGQSTRGRRRRLTFCRVPLP